MSEVTHVIDADTPGDMLEQMLTMRRGGERIISLGPPPEGDRVGKIESLHKPFGQEKWTGCRLAERLPRKSVVHLWSSGTLEAGCSAAERVGGRVVLSLPHLPYKESLADVTGEIDQFGHTLTVPTSRARDELLALGTDPRQVAVLPPAAEPPSDPPGRRNRVRKGLGLTEDDILMVVPVEMIRYGGHKFASWSHAIVRQVVDAGRLLFPGSGPLEKAVLFFANTTGYLDEVFFTGWRFSRQDVLSAADAALFFYERDCGLTGLAEAMAAGLPILASRTPDLSTICQHEQNALLAEPSDPRTASAAVLRLIDDPDLAARLAQAGREYAKKTFSPQRARKHLEQIYANSA